MNYKYLALLTIIIGIAALSCKEEAKVQTWTETNNEDVLAFSNYAYSKVVQLNSNIISRIQWNDDGNVFISGLWPTNIVISNDWEGTVQFGTNFYRFATFTAENINVETKRAHEPESKWSLAYSNGFDGPFAVARMQGARITGQYRIDYSTNYSGWKPGDGYDGWPLQTNKWMIGTNSVPTTLTFESSNTGRTYTVDVGHGLWTHTNVIDIHKCSEYCTRLRYVDGAVTNDLHTAFVTFTVKTNAPIAP